ncbi:MAG: LysE family translocator [Pseudomonadota bacterium]
MPLDQLVAFIAAGLLLNLAPGPDVVYIVTNALRSGARAGIVAGFGITAGCFVHIAAAALGVSALLAASATAFTVLKWVGAAYLVWVGLRMLLARQASALSLEVEDSPGSGARSLKSIFLMGFWTNVLNPKVALFFLAFVPQFIPADTANKPLMFVLLGLLFNFNSVFVNSAWAVFAAGLARRVDRVRKAGFMLEKAAGLMFVAFGIQLALSDAPKLKSAAS